jgi:predicted HicB family RNase H-like nuclease
MKMTAYELADKLENQVNMFDHPFVSDSADMLRQQADRIAELEKKLQESAFDYISVCSQADEHYARVQELEKQLDIHFKNGFEAGKLEGWKAHKYHSTPQTKPLSDDEIWEWFEKNTALTKESALMICRAIEERHGIK